MSGGFFRGTSADQDTRFSNKQAKLMKSQKFASELEHLVDVRKVKMDVIRPWIASRVTELLGFEDEVLINFIYGLLDGKEVNGKEVQISLTGFMEKNTGKFMKELWGLLLSAQSNESGVPQQFLDAKEEETRKKQAEVDRITSEIQKKKEKEKESRDIGGERSKKMDGVADRNDAVAMGTVSKDVTSRGMSRRLEEDKEAQKRNNVRGRSRFSRSPPSADRSPFSPRDSPRGSKSLSNSRSYSGDRRKSRSRTRSPDTRRRSVSSERGYRSSRKQSISPRQKRSPRNSPSSSRRRSSYSRQRSRSPSRRRSPSPVPRRRLHSPYRRRRSPSPIRRRRSPSPIRRRRSPHRRSPSPVRRRSPSPIRRRRSPSPIRRCRSPSPIRRHRSPSPMRGRSRSPIKRRSSSPRSSRSPIPLRRRSPPPLHRRSQRSPSTPVRHKSPLPLRRRSPSPRHSSPSPCKSSSSSPVRHKSPLPAAIHRRSPTPLHQRSPSLGESRSPSPARRRSFSPVRNRSPEELRRSPVARDRLRAVEKSPPRSLTPPRRDLEKQKDFQDKSPAFSLSPKRSPVRSESPVLTRKKTVGQYRSPYESPVSKRRGTATNGVSRSPEKRREQKPHHLIPDSRETEETNYARISQKRSEHAYSAHEQKGSPVKHVNRNGHSPGSNRRESRKKDQETVGKRSSGRNDYPENSDEQGSPTLFKDGKRQSIAGESNKSDDRNRLHSNDIKDHAGQIKSKTIATLEKADCDHGGKTRDSGSEESDKRRAEKKERRKHKRSHKREEASDDADSYDSEIDERKDAKRRRKEEKKLRKEEKRRRREERRRRKEERSAEKRKLKDRHYTDSSEDEHDRRDSNLSDDEDTQSQQKRLEIELRKKALESLKAKKGISH